MNNKLISVQNFLHVITVITQISFWKGSIGNIDTYGICSFNIIGGS